MSGTVWDEVVYDGVVPTPPTNLTTQAKVSWCASLVRETPETVPDISISAQITYLTLHKGYVTLQFK